MMREEHQVMEVGGSHVGRKSVPWVALLVGCALAVNFIACRDESSPPTDQQIVKVPGARKGKGRGKGHDEERARKAYQPTMPAPKRTFFVSAHAEADGAGTEASPWRDLQRALAQLEPGDQLSVLPGAYRGPFVIDRSCKDGTAEAPIRVVGLEDTQWVAGEGEAILVMTRPFWIFQRLEIVGGNSRKPAVVLTGADAHDLLLEEIHLRNGWGEGIKIGKDVRRLTIANCHIHNFGHPKHARKSGGILLEEGVAEITIVGNNIHNGVAGPVYMAGHKYGATLPDGTIEAPPGVTLSQNRMGMSWEGD